MTELTRYHGNPSLSFPLGTSPWTFHGELGTPVNIQSETKQVLVPDSISDALGRLAALTQSRRVLDIGIGSGIFPASMIINSKDTEPAYILGIDKNYKAIQTAKMNLTVATANIDRGLQIDLIQSDWLSSIYTPSEESKFSTIYFNPPYLRKGHNIKHSPQQNAPESALYAEDPWNHYGKVLPTLPKHLARNGMAIVRLPREPDEDFLQRLNAFRNSQQEPFDSLLVTIHTPDRIGKAMIIIRGELPAEYGDWQSYQTAVHNGSSALYELYADSFCKVIAHQNLQQPDVPDGNQAIHNCDVRYADLDGERL